MVLSTFPRSKIRSSKKKKKSFGLDTVQSLQVFAEYFCITVNKPLSCTRLLKAIFSLIPSVLVFLTNLDANVTSCNIYLPH